jgi:hypothetical protein
VADGIRHLRVVLAEHDAEGLVGDEIVNRQKAVLRVVGGDKAGEQNIVRGKGGCLAGHAQPS